MSPSVFIVSNTRVPQNGAAIKALRTKDGYSQADFAEQIEITPSALSHIEVERKAAGEVLLNRMARKLCVPVSAIVRCTHAVDETALESA